MKKISHRGNLNGRIPERENSPDYIVESLSLGYNCEIDVWVVNDEYFLGHDKAQYKIEETFLESNLLWCHAKNIQALEKMLKNKKIHCFWHQNDDVTLTSKGFIWTYPNKELTKKSICVLPELNSFDMGDCYGVCSDYIQQYK
jgi:hypothetical protein